MKKIEMKKLLALCLILCLCTCLFPVSAFAEEPAEREERIAAEDVAALLADSGSMVADVSAEFRQAVDVAFENVGDTLTGGGYTGAALIALALLQMLQRRKPGTGASANA